MPRAPARPQRLTRRALLGAGAVLYGALAAAGGAGAVGLTDAAPQRFDFDRLTDTMRARAAAPYVAPEPIRGPLAALS